MKIDNYQIGKNHPPFLIAEMSGNHNQSLSRALKIVDAAARSGAHAIKLQTYKPETITIKSKNKEFKINDADSLWDKKDLFTLYKSACTPYEWHKPIFDRAREKGLVCFSSPFDEGAVDFLEDLNVPAYKIASFENNHYPLIEKVASTGKPIIISTGMATLDELKEVYSIVKESRSKNLIFLKCTSTYPASPDNTNILTIPELRKIFKCEIGISDHTLGIGTSIGAVALGATVIEKHFTLDRSDGGVDSAFSMEPFDFKMLASESYNAWLSLGRVFIGPTENEKKSLKFRRSIYAIKDIDKGDLFSENNIAVIRPGNGIHPRHFKDLIGKKSLKKIKYGSPITDLY